MAEKEAQKVREDLAYAEKELAAIKRKPLFDKPAREKPQAESAEKTVEKVEEEPKAEPQQVVAAL